MEWTDGMLYPVLHRLERLGYIKARWEEAESGRRRKYYRITSQGKSQLAEERKQWQAVDATLRGIWKMISHSVLAIGRSILDISLTVEIRMFNFALRSDSSSLCLDRKIIAEAQRSRRNAEDQAEGVTLCEVLRPPRLCGILFRNQLILSAQGA